ncbi:unnamed protein product [Thelazia callipaeda]|uniref:Spindle pole body component 97 n=1 Tax=Thelazia callipaeda TaxID=103827 RepID=A0A0N5CZN9_THECL|nr:unnamed protein product [Thelazia callipaeda]
MSSGQPECLTSLVSYVPDFTFGQRTDIRNQLTTSTIQGQNLFIPEVLEVVSARGNTNCEPICERSISPPLRSALKKTNLKKFEDNTEDIKKEESQSIPKRPLDVVKKEGQLKAFPARLLQKKKTVAFGRTVNLSQTIEGASKSQPKLLMDSSSQNDKIHKVKQNSSEQQLMNELKKLKEDVRTLQIKIDELLVKDSERSDQFLRLTETLKVWKLLLQLINILALDKDVATNGTNENFSSVPHQGEFEKNKKQIMEEPSKEELKWAMMKRKYAENENFKRLVDEAIMKFGGDESLDIFADQNKGDISRKKSHPVSPVIRSTTRVTRQMTVKQVQRPRSPSAFSYDSKKYLARYGIIPAVSDVDDFESKIIDDEQQQVSVQSNYHPGNSVTYYSRNVQCNNLHRKNEGWLDFAGNCYDPEYRKERRYYTKKKPSRTVYTETNYQIDHFDNDEDENVDDVIEVSDSSEAEDYYPPEAQMRSPRNIRVWRGHCKKETMPQHMNERINRSAWD